MEDILNNPQVAEFSALFSEECGLIEFSIEWGMRFLAALMIIVAGWTIGRFFSNRIHSVHRIDPTLKSFLAALTRYTIMAVSVITVIGLDFGSYLTGSILTETIFSWPGIGRYVVMAIGRRDLPAIQGSVLFLSLVFVFVNVFTDLAYRRADPRLR